MPPLRAPRATSAPVAAQVASLLDCPTEDRFHMPEDGLRTCVRARLALPHPAFDPGRAANPSTQCNHTNASTGVRCGRALDAQGVHADTCQEGNAAVRGHDGTCDELQLYLLDCGSEALREQRVPAWDRPLLDDQGNVRTAPRLDKHGNSVLDDAGRPLRDVLYDRAVLDVSFRERGAGRRAHADVTIGAVATIDTAERSLRAQHRAKGRRLRDRGLCRATRR